MCQVTPRCRRFCVGSWVKFLYLSCATLATASFIVECILLHLVIVPYIAESDFVSSRCSFNRSELGKKIRCENKCSKDRSHFPCMQIYVTHYAEQEKKTHVAVLYDYYSTYEHYRATKCATSPCRKRERDNVIWVEQFKKSLTKQQTFPCYTSLTHPNEVLLNTLETSVFLHSLLWPVLIFVTSLFILSITYCIDRCRVWADDKTVIA